VWATNQTESNWGLIHNWNNSGSQPLAYSAKPAYVAMCAMSSMLGGAEYDGKVSASGGVYGYRFKKDGKYIVVAWTTDTNGKSFTATSDGEIIITDMYGNASGPYTGSSTHSLTINPIYIEYSQSNTLNLKINK
jgi:hypothetical protein